MPSHLLGINTINDRGSCQTNHCGGTFYSHQQTFPVTLLHTTCVPRDVTSQGESRDAASLSRRGVRRHRDATRDASSVNPPVCANGIEKDTTHTHTCTHTHTHKGATVCACMCVRVCVTHICSVNEALTNKTRHLSTVQWSPSPLSSAAPPGCATRNDLWQRHHHKRSHFLPSRVTLSSHLHHKRKICLEKRYIRFYLESS